jgi:hypothetical protein
MVTTAFFILALSASFALGRWSTSVRVHTESQTEAPAWGEDHSVRTSVGLGALDETVDAGFDEAPSCQDRLTAALDREARAIVEEKYCFRRDEWTSVPFPIGLAPQYRSEGFEKALNAVLRECPEAGLDLAYLDCGEFPCMAFFTQHARTYSEGTRRLFDCDSWERTFYGEYQQSSFFMIGTSRMEYSVIAPLPAGIVPDSNMEERRFDRVRDGRRELMVTWAGTEPTQLERIEEEIDYWLNIDDGSGTTLPVYENIARRLRDERESILEAKAKRGE